MRRYSFLEPEAEGPGRLTLGMKIREEWEGDAAEAAGPGLVAVLTIHGDADDRGVRRGELTEQLLGFGNLLASGGGEIEGIEEHANIALCEEVRRGHVLVVLVLQGEGWGRITDIDHLCISGWCCFDSRGCPRAMGGGTRVPASALRFH